MRSRTTTGSEATRQRLLDAATTVLLRGGPIGASARSIAAESGIAQAAVFYHFGSIDELLTVAVERAVVTQRGVMRASLAEARDLGDVLASLGDLGRDREVATGIALTTQLAVAAGTDSATSERVRHLQRSVVAEIAESMRRVIDAEGLRAVVSPEGAAELAAALLYGSWVLDSASSPSEVPVAAGGPAETLELVGPVLRLVAARGRRREATEAQEAVLVLT
jgi:AcrR family transcriptional regulator